MSNINWKFIRIDGLPECEWGVAGPEEKQVLVAFKRKQRQRPIVKKAIFNPIRKTFMVEEYDKDTNRSMNIDIYKFLIAWADLSNHTS